MMIKYQHNPGETRDRYDARLDVAILRVRPTPKEAQELFEAKHAAWEADPTSGDEPQRVDDFELFLPENTDALRGIKRKFSATDPQAEDDLLYNDRNAEGDPCFKFKKQRRFETYQSQPARDPYSDNIAIALHDPETYAGFVPGAKSRLQKAAYYYPILQRVGIRAYRPRTVARLLQNPGLRADVDEDDEGRADQLNVTIIPEEQEEFFAQQAQAFRDRFDQQSST